MTHRSPHARCDAGPSLDDVNGGPWLWHGKHYPRMNTPTMVHRPGNPNESEDAVRPGVGYVCFRQGHDSILIWEDDIPDLIAALQGVAP